MANEQELKLLINNQTDYASVIEILRRHNQDLYRPMNTVVRDQNFQSDASHIRELLYSSKQPTLLKKQEYLGIVLRVEVIQTIRPTYKIYVHVPKDDLDNIPEADNFNVALANNQINIADFEHLVFYPVSDSVVGMSIPSPKNIVRVQPADNFFNSTFVNPLDNRYLGIFCDASRASVPPSTDVAQMPSVNASQALEGVNVPSSGKSLQANGVIKRFSKVNSDVLIYSFNKLKSLFSDLSNEQIAGIIGNFMIESGMDATITNSIGAFGIAQWLGPRKRKLIELANEKNKPVYNLDFQLEFVAYESKLAPKPPKYNFGEINALRDLKTKTSPEEAAISWMQRWERPSPTEQAESGPKRAAAAREVYNLYTNPSKPAEAVSSVPKPATNNTQKNKSGASASNPVSFPVMKLVNFEADYATNVRKDDKLGSKRIKIREDIFSDLEQIKNILNKFNSSLSLNSYDININNKNISLLAKIGLEINLNINAGLTNFMNPETDDYLIGPDYNFPLGNGYKLIVYANVKKNINYFNEKYNPEIKLFDIYNIRNTYLKNKPEIVKICKPLINLTKIFEDFGFINKYPKKEFFLNSSPINSYWNVFQKTSKINKGLSYKELLKTVYLENDEQIWKEKDLFWDGSNFV